MIIDIHTIESHPAIRRHHLGAIIADMAAFNGWIRCKTSMPIERNHVLITDGKYYTIANWYGEESGWDTIDFLPEPNHIIAWRLLPEIPQELIEKCKV